ncbi:UPF0103-domain-containing protein [Piedraia hortae CBS 480.64]|uniref:UPF0103-domain-containing protein n=1 Tax=Piedraia hortae CBS 480.64 TaxID=1314780 RepID=A0A6A7C9L2_9PEZI|nr:UPF0103-domain-containing protein [Piedraia hortae CBS 480.64]
MPTNTVRRPSHAGSWYKSSKSQLNAELDEWLAAVDPPVVPCLDHKQSENVTQLPVPGARVIIGPHAGYAYSGPAAAYAYKAWDVSKAKRVFLLGPSHHHYLRRAALTGCTHYSTPLGDLVIDRETTDELQQSSKFETMSLSVDEAEHSLEMHLPYIYKLFSQHVTFGNDSSKFPLLVPIMVGNTSSSTEVELGKLLAPYLSDPSTAFVVSSDFCHWGLRFDYTYYRPSSGKTQNLTSSSHKPIDPPIHESIKAVDEECMEACESGKLSKWVDVLKDTGNTVCGRHPISVIMAAMETLQSGTFRFVRYERSSEVSSVRDSSVSYASAFAVV